MDQIVRMVPVQSEQSGDSKRTVPNEQPYPTEKHVEASTSQSGRIILSSNDKVSGANIIILLFSVINTGKEYTSLCKMLVGWLVFNDNTRDKDDTTVGVGHSRRYCNTGYDQSQGRRPSTLECIGPISKGDIEPNHPSEINPNP